MAPAANGDDVRDRPRVAVVTDSTCDLPWDVAEREGLRVVPMAVAFGTESLVSGVTIQLDEFWTRLESAQELPTTSQPNPHWFIEAWSDARDEGLEAVVSLHLSRALSGTVDQARRLAEDAPLPVRVVDTGQVGGGLALSALAAARTAATGALESQVHHSAIAVAEAVVTRVVVDTMEFLHRGGRVAGASALVGRALRVKPVLGMQDGELVAMGRARTMSRGLRRIAEELAATFGDEPLAVVVTHAVAPAHAQLALDALGDAVVVASRQVQVFGPVLGTHAGPGAVAIAAAPARLLEPG